MVTIGEFKMYPVNKPILAGDYLVEESNGFVSMTHYDEGWNCYKQPDGTVNKNHEIKNIVAYAEIFSEGKNNSTGRGMTFDFYQLLMRRFHRMSYTSLIKEMSSTYADLIGVLAEKACSSGVSAEASNENDFCREKIGVLLQEVTELASMSGFSLDQIAQSAIHRNWKEKPTGADCIRS